MEEFYEDVEGFMKRMKVILALMGDEKNHITEIFFNLGLTPIIRQTMEQALSKLRHEHCDAIYINRDNAEVDALEFILNARDINQTIPIIVFGKPANEYKDNLLIRQDNVFLLPEETQRPEQKIKEFLEQI